MRRHPPGLARQRSQDYGLARMRLGLAHERLQRQIGEAIRPSLESIAAALRDLLTGR